MANDKPTAQDRPTKLARLKAVLLYIVLAGAALGLGLLVANYIVMPLMVGGGGDVEVPDMANMSFEAATALLEELGLGYKKEAEEYSADVPDGYVVAQRPEAGMMAQEGRVIGLTVSAGSEVVRVPNLTGMARAQAEDALTRLGLELGKVRENYNPEIPESSVIGQNPEPGTEVPRGTKINLLVSLGSEEAQVSVPNLVNTDYQTAYNRLTTWGLEVGNVNSGYSTTVRPGYIYKQVPEVGTMVQKGEKIDLYVSLGPPAGGSIAPEGDTPPDDGETPPPDQF
jgi:eukaryotic-like serine/threonine-protein kinase